MPGGVNENLLYPAQRPGSRHGEFIFIEVELSGIVQVNGDLVAEERPDHRVGGQRLEDVIQRLRATEASPKTAPTEHVSDQGQMVSVLGFVAVAAGRSEDEGC